MFRFAIVLLALARFSVPAAIGGDLPSEEDRKKASAAVKDVYADDTARAKTPLQKAILAAKVRETAGSEKDAANRWAMLDLARDLAAQAGDARQVNDIVSELNGDYGNASLAFAASGEKMVKAGLATYVMVDVLLICVDAAIEIDDYPAAVRTAEGAIVVANRVRDSRAAKYFVFARKRAADLEKKFAAARDDPDAVARFHFFDKQDIRVGIPLLAKMKNAKLADAARKDMKADILSGSEMTEVGDAWSSLADNAPDEEKISLLLAAIAAYSKANANLTGLEKTKCDNRTKELTEKVDAQEIKNGTFLTFAGSWVYEGADTKNEEFTIHRSGRILMDSPTGRWYLSRQNNGKRVVLTQHRVISRWTVLGDALTIELSINNPKVGNTINATRKQ
jgi:hypothetical protein